MSYHKRLFSQLDVQRVEVPRGEFAEIQGRAGLVRCVRGRVDFTAISNNFPVKCVGERRQDYERVVRLMVRWLREQVDLTPQRSMLCICMGRNDNV